MGDQRLKDRDLARLDRRQHPDAFLRAHRGRTAITSIPANALTVALKVGHQFVLPTDQVVTLTAAASVGATSLTVSSVTPSAAVASAASLLPLITVTFAMTPTGVTLGRADEMSVSAPASSDTSERRACVNLMNHDDNGNASFLSITVS